MSNVIKAQHYISLDHKKMIEAAHKSIVFHGKNAENPLTGETDIPLELQEEINQALALKEQITKEAEAYAEEQIKSAVQQAELLRTQTAKEIEEWWQERRLQDEQYISEAKQAGFTEGHQDGLAQAEAAVRNEYHDMLQEARSIIEQAVVVKQQIIQESEPFLIELSSSIAEKVIRRQLEIKPDLTIDLVKQVLSRRREKGVITLCVAPTQFSFIQNARDELSLAIDSQAELQIVPDFTVGDSGCVVRSSFGSIDARIDTQLNEIKKSLQQITERSRDS